MSWLVRELSFSGRPTNSGYILVLLKICKASVNTNSHIKIETELECTVEIRFQYTALNGQ